MKYDSPLRYPGGKASLASFLTRTIETNNLAGCSYFEPFAGGAGAAIRLLREGTVSDLHLNDLDPRITSFWRTVLNESERLVDAILSVPLSISEWKTQKNICQRADTSGPFELGFATFYLNRCNRSGILLGAAPIGGYAQTGEWRIDARFNRESLAERILAIATKRDHIHITNMDARTFLSTHLPHRHRLEHVFAYLDPPYYSNGSRLYMNFFTDRDHRRLARYMQRQHTLNWMMSYDDADFIRDLYADCDISQLSLQYSLQRKRQAKELLIAPARVRIPRPVNLNDNSRLNAVSNQPRKKR